MKSTVQKTVFRTAGALLLAFVCGCNTTPLRDSGRAMLPEFKAPSQVVTQRAAALKKVMAPMKERSVEIVLSAWRSNAVPPEELMAVIRELGFNRIGCHISSEAELADDLRGLLLAASDAGVPVELTLRQGDFKHRFRGNALVRSLLPQFRQLPELAEDILEFNSTLPEKAKIAGVTVRFEPHLFTLANGAAEIPGMHYLWSDETFGKGLDNDKLTELSLKQLKNMKSRLKTLPLSVEVPDFYPLWQKEGKLSLGSVKDFSAIGKVKIRCTGNVPSQLVLRSKAALSGSRNLTAVIPLADHTSVSSGALRRRDWNDLVRAVGYFINATQRKECSGIVLRPLSELSYMLLEKD